MCWRSIVKLVLNAITVALCIIMFVYCFMFVLNIVLNKYQCMAFEGHCSRLMITVVINNLHVNHFIIHLYFIVYL